MSCKDKMATVTSFEAFQMFSREETPTLYVGLKDGFIYFLICIHWIQCDFHILKNSFCKNVIKGKLIFLSLKCHKTAVEELVLPSTISKKKKRYSM